MERLGRPLNPPQTAKKESIEVLGEGLAARSLILAIESEADCGKYRQVAGAIAKAVMGGRGELGHLTLNKIKNHKTRGFLATERAIAAAPSMQAIRRPTAM